MLVVYLIAFLAGVLRLHVRQQLLLSGTAVVAYGVMVIALYRFKPKTVEPADEIVLERVQEQSDVALIDLARHD